MSKRPYVLVNIWMVRAVLLKETGTNKMYRPNAYGNSCVTYDFFTESMNVSVMTEAFDVGPIVKRLFEPFSVNLSLFVCESLRCLCHCPSFFSTTSLAQIVNVAAFFFAKRKRRFSAAVLMKNVIIQDVMHSPSH